MPPKPLIELTAVTLRINDRLAFPCTNWTFARNQNWAVVGPNGSGKTLLARALAGEIPVVEGEIRYTFDHPVDRVPEDYVLLVSFEQQKAIAGDAPPAVRWFSVEQDWGLTVSEFLSQDRVEEINPFEVGARREQTPRAFRQHRQQILELLQIRPLLGHSLPSLSNGEMRKVLLARALLRRPRLLILDDAFAGLDAKYRIYLKGILEKLIRRGSVRILLIDSLLHDMPRGITHVLCVDDCKVVAQGPRKDMIRHPRVRRLFRPAGMPPLHLQLNRERGRKSTGASEELVRMEHASVRYNGRDILSDITWTIRRGESWALTGPNGSGKTTLLSLISGDNPQAYANSVYLFGRRRGTGESVWAIKKRIGSISSELHLHFPDSQDCLQVVLSGFHESSGCYRRASTEQRASAWRMLDRFGLGEVANRGFHSLSAGSQQMVLLARALVKSPD